MNVERALREIANMNDPESGASALDGDELFEAATALAAEVRRLHRANEDDCWGFAEILVRVKRRLALLEAPLEEKP